MGLIQIVTKAEIRRVVEPIVDGALEPEGFERATELRWVRGHSAPIRHVFELAAWKGGHIAPRWGLSLDFVPHIAGAKVKWHRTQKSATCDFCIDAHLRELEIPVHAGPDALAAAAPGAIAKGLESARSFWSTAQSESDLVSVLDAVRASCRTALGFGMYTQHPIAAAFVLARAGRVEEALHEIEPAIAVRPPYFTERTRDELMKLLTAQLPG